MRSRLILTFAAACGSTHTHATPDATASDATAGTDAATFALGPLMPQEVAGNASAIMATPTVVAITYDGDPQRGDVEAFYRQYAASPAWALQTSEYGIGAFTIGAPRHLTGAAASSDAAIRQLLAANLGGANPAWGAPSESTLYSFTLPLDSKFTDNHGGQNFCGGYHDDVLVGSVDVAYSIQLQCTGDFPPPITALQALTLTLAHELVEAVTDPRYEHDYAWGDVDPAHEVWTYTTDGELADLCFYTDTAFWTDAPGMTYAIQRIWSNAAARAGTDPCIGDPTTPYVQAVPDQPDDVTMSLFGTNVATKAKKIAVGATGAITVRVAGTPGAGPVSVTAVDIAMLFGAATPALELTQPSGSFHVGDTVTIPVTVMAKDTNLGAAEAFMIETKPTGGGPTTYYYGLVGQ